MLAPQNDYAYSVPSMGGYDHQGSQQQHALHHHQHSGERPKLFGLDSAQSGMHGGGSGGGMLQHAGMHDFQQIVHQTPQHNMTPQHQHHQQQQGNFDHEPLMMNMQHGNQYYPPMGAQMLHVSTDYSSNGSVRGGTPSSGAKRSREELNMKEKKRMFKLNDRINQLKDILDEAGVQSKKNKQSILDNTHHYIGMLRSNLLIAKQKAERAEKQAEVYRAQVQTSSGGVDATLKRCFEQSSTPRLVADLSLRLLAVNSAFLAQTGQSEDSLAGLDTLRASLCLDNGKLDTVVQSVTSTMKPISAIVQAQGPGNNVSTLTLMASVVTDEDNSPSAIEFSLVPFEISSEFSPTGYQSSSALKSEQHKESSPSSVNDLAL